MRGPPHRHLPVEAVDRPPDVGFPEQDARIVEQVAGREVVGPVHDDVVVAQDLEGAGGVEADRVLAYLDARVHPADGARAVQHLTLEVAHLHDVVVDDPDRAHSGSGQVEQHRRAQPPGTDYEHARGGQPLLAGQADPGKQDVPGIPLDVVLGEGAADGSERRQRHPPTLPAARCEVATRA